MPAGVEQLSAVRDLVRTATSRLLGDTIAVADEDWRAPSRLPHWSRAHVATHLARHADAVRRLTRWAVTGEREEMYASPQQRDDEIEAGARATGAGAADRPGHQLRVELERRLRSARPRRGLGRRGGTPGRTAGVGPAAAVGPADRGGRPPRRPGCRLRGRRHRRHHRRLVAGVVGLPAPPSRRVPATGTQVDVRPHHLDRQFRATDRPSGGPTPVCSAGSPAGPTRRRSTGPSGLTMPSF